MSNRTTSTTSTEIMLLNILYIMHDDNIRQIRDLQAANNNIRNSIVTHLSRSTINNHENRFERNRNLYPDATENRRSTRGHNNSHNYSNTNSNNSSTNHILASQNNIQANRRGHTNAQIFPRRHNSFFDPIVVYPSQTQIEIATRNVLFCDIIRPKNLSCPITLEPFHDNDTVTTIRYCGHIFNTVDILLWFQSNCRCPVCRYDIREYRQNNANLETNQFLENEETDENLNENTENENIENNNTENENIENNNTENIQRNNFTFDFDISNNFIGNLTDTLLNELIHNYDNNYDNNYDINIAESFINGNNGNNIRNTLQTFLDPSNNNFSINGNNIRNTLQTFLDPSNNNFSINRNNIRNTLQTFLDPSNNAPIHFEFFQSFLY
jgi:hypothetical protein